MQIVRGNDETESNRFKNKIVVKNKSWTVFLQQNVSKVSNMALVNRLFASIKFYIVIFNFP